MKPKSLEALPLIVQDYWVKTYESARKYVDEGKASKVAWNCVKNNVHKEGDLWVARIKGSKDFERATFVFKAHEDSVTRSSDGFVYRDYVLTSKKDVFSDFAFKRMAEQINEQGLKGRVDNHKLYHYLKEKLKLSEDEIEEELQKIDSGIEAVKASYDGDKIIATIKMTSEVFEKAKDLNAASIEARMPFASLKEGVYNQARLMGFVLTDSPMNPDAVAIS